jgi:hypothetical protein
MYEDFGSYFFLKIAAWDSPIAFIKKNVSQILTIITYSKFVWLKLLGICAKIEEYY